MTPLPSKSNLPSPELCERLRSLARAAAGQAYAPYSGFRVGAAVLVASSSVTELTVTGCNVENASYRLTTCAEQAAITAAVRAHGPGLRLAGVAIVNLNGAASSPCGACRQTILEFATEATWVIYPISATEHRVGRLTDLLPAGFQLAAAPCD